MFRLKLHVVMTNLPNVEKLTAVKLYNKFFDKPGLQQLDLFGEESIKHPLQLSHLNVLIPFCTELWKADQSFFVFQDFRKKQ